MEPAFAVGQVWRTRDGKEVMITAVRNGVIECSDGRIRWGNSQNTGWAGRINHTQSQDDDIVIAWIDYVSSHAGRYAQEALF
jgi:hypothetical protein